MSVQRGCLTQTGQDATSVLAVCVSGGARTDARSQRVAKCQRAATVNRTPYSVRRTRYCVLSTPPSAHHWSCPLSGALHSVRRTRYSVHGTRRQILGDRKTWRRATYSVLRTPYPATHRRDPGPPRSRSRSHRHNRHGFPCGADLSMSEEDTRPNNRRDPHVRAHRFVPHFVQHFPCRQTRRPAENCPSNVANAPRGAANGRVPRAFFSRPANSAHLPVELRRTCLACFL